MTDRAVIHVVDDDPLFRPAVARFLQAAGYEVALYASGDELVKDSAVLEPGCILLDLNMPGLSGLELQDRLKEIGSIQPIVFLTGAGDIPTTVKAMKAGAEDFLSKPVSNKALLAAIERALTRYWAQRKERDQIDSLRALFSTLTRRERQVFSLVVRGKLNKEIAYELGASERTIKAHRHAIMNKLKVRSVAAAVSIAERLGVTSSNGDKAG